MKDEPDKLPALVCLEHALMDVEAWLRTEAAFVQTRGSAFAFPGGLFRLGEITYTVDYALREDDPDFDEDDDNYLFSARHAASDHCSLFEELCHRSDLTPDDLLRIGDIYVDLIYCGMYASKSLTDPNDACERVAVTPFTWDKGEKYHSKRYRDERERRLSEGVREYAFEDLSFQEQAHCQRINAELKFIEKNDALTRGALAERLNARVTDQSDLVDDYEVELSVDYELGPNDPLAGNTDSMILIRRDGGPVPKRPEDQIRVLSNLDLDWCESILRDNSGIKHCYLYHDLYDHTYLDWKDLPRIDRIVVTIEVWLQRFISVSDVSSTR